MRFQLAAVIVVIFGTVGTTVYLSASNGAKQQAVSSLMLSC